MVIWDFQNFEFLITTFSKTGIYGLKTGICYTHAKFWGNPSIFGPQIAQKTRKPYISKFWIPIFGSCRPSTKIKIPPLNSPLKTKSDKNKFCLKRPTSKFDLVWPDLTWPQPEIHPNVIKIIQWVSPLHSMGKITHKTCVAHSPFSSYFVMTFGDLTWPDLELCMAS